VGGRRRLAVVLAAAWAVLGVAAVWILLTTTWYVTCDTHGVPGDGMDCAFKATPKTDDGFPGSIGFDPLVLIVAVAVVWVAVTAAVLIWRRPRP
jgi:hypothetical protein